MPRYRKAPLTLPELAHDGPPVRVRDLVAITGLCEQTIRSEIKAARVPIIRQSGNSPFLILRHDARKYLGKIGMLAIAQSGT